MTQKKSDEKQVQEIHDVLTDLVKRIVRNPDEVLVSRKDVSQFVAFAVKTEQDDVRRLLGKQGKHFKSLEIICREALKHLGRESLLAIDEQPNFKSPGAAIPARDLGKYSARKFASVEKLLKRLVAVFISEPSKLFVASTEISTTIILEVTVAEGDYPAIYGKPAEFEYGTDGHLIGSIKNYFDGIGKNNGRIIRMVVNKV